MSQISAFRRRCSGVTMIEVIITSGILGMVAIIGVNTMITGVRSLHSGMINNTVEADAHRGIRYVARSLQEAMEVSIASDGRSITYYLPAKEVTGEYAVPMVKSTIARMFYVAAGPASDNGRMALYEQIGSSQPRAIIRNLYFTDPRTGQTGTNFKIFRSYDSGLVHMVALLIVTQIPNGERTVTSRIRESVYLRNIPTLTR